MKHRAPPQEMGILHLPERVLNVVLGTIGADNVFIRPVGVIREQNGLAELDAAEAVERCLVGGVGEFQTFADSGYLGFENQLHKLPRTDRLDLLSHRLQRGRFAFYFSLSPAFELLLQGAQLAPRFVQTGGQPLELPVEQILIERDQDGPCSAEDFFLSAVNFHPLQTVAW